MPPIAVEDRSNRSRCTLGMSGELSLGQTDHGGTEHQVGHGRAQQHVGVASGGPAVGVEDVVDAVGRDDAGDAAPQPFVVERPGDRADVTWKRFHSSRRRCRPRAGPSPRSARIASSGWSGGRLAADDRLEGERPDRHAAGAADLVVERGIDVGLGGEEIGDRGVEQGVHGRGPEDPEEGVGDAFGGVAAVDVPAAPLWAMARWNRPGREATPSSVPTLMPPADSPKIVTLPGSPPKAAMLSRTHAGRPTWSRMPWCPTRRSASPRSAEVEEAERAEAVVDRHDHDVARAGEGGAVVPGRCRPSRSTNAPPWIHTMTGRRASSAAGVHTLRTRQSSLDGRRSAAPSMRLERATGSAGRWVRTRWRRGRRPRARRAGVRGTVRPGRTGCRGTGGPRASRGPAPCRWRCRRSRAAG